MSVDDVAPPQKDQADSPAQEPASRAGKGLNWRILPGNRGANKQQHVSNPSKSGHEHTSQRPKWNMGILNDAVTDEVPGSILLLSKGSRFNEPLGMRDAPARTSTSSLPSPYASSRASSRRRRPPDPEKKRTPDGKIILEPQPDDSLNDPLNWRVWRRDASLFSLGFYCMLGGGMTTVLAAGFNEVARDYHVSVPRVALTTGLYMMGLGLGSVVLSPTAILFGKRPVYLVASVCFVLTAVWCALSPSFSSLIVARIFMGFAVSSVECLPSASIAEIYFLHEKAYRLGIYTFLLLGGKNLIPLVSAAIIESLGWRWVFWIVAIVVGFAACLLFLFVPESFWDRSPTPHRQHRSTSFSGLRRSLSHFGSPTVERKGTHDSNSGTHAGRDGWTPSSPNVTRHAHFQHSASDDDEKTEADMTESPDLQGSVGDGSKVPEGRDISTAMQANDGQMQEHSPPSQLPSHSRPAPINTAGDYFSSNETPPILEAQTSAVLSPISRVSTGQDQPSDPPNAYTAHYQAQPPKGFIQQLKPWSGRLTHDNWFRVAVRPFILYAYPSILWSALVYALSVGWLIVLSESVAYIFENRNSYNFTPLQTGLVYISPFVGGVLGTVVAGKCSDIVVRFLAHRNGGVYEPEFRLVMGIPIAIFTVIGLMGYGWSAQERDAWIVPTIFFGFISFGCTLGSTTAITFAVDSYRQYAGEALVTLNFSKNILHGLVFSLFFNRWLQADGARDVFIAIGGIQLGCLLTTIPMYIYGKRARMWTVRKNLMEKF